MDAKKRKKIITISIVSFFAIEIILIILSYFFPDSNYGLISLVLIFAFIAAIFFYCLWVLFRELILPIYKTIKNKDSREKAIKGTKSFLKAIGWLIVVIIGIILGIIVLLLVGSWLAGLSATAIIIILLILILFK